VTSEVMVTWLVLLIPAWKFRGFCRLIAVCLSLSKQTDEQYLNLGFWDCR